MLGSSLEHPQALSCSQNHHYDQECVKDHWGKTENNQALDESCSKYLRSPLEKMNKRNQKHQKNSGNPGKVQKKRMPFTEAYPQTDDCAQAIEGSSQSQQN